MCKGLKQDQILIWGFIYIQALCMQAAKAKMRLLKSADSPEPLLLDIVKSTKFHMLD